MTTLKNYLRSFFTPRLSDAELQHRLDDLKARAPVPVFWLFGKTQSGKTTIVKYLSGAEDAEVGAGFKPTTRFSRQYQFPTAEAPLLTFLDTRGLDEPGYEASEDLARFNELAHVVIVTARVMDHAQERVVTHLEEIRAAARHRPIVLALTCLHEAYPQQQHPVPFPFGTEEEHTVVPEALRRSIAQQRERFRGLVDVVVPIDITPAGEGFNDPVYGGPQLKGALIELLPTAYRQTLLSVEAATGELRDWHERRAMPYILSYSTMAATAGAFPIPWVDLFFLPAIQSRMVYRLAQLYGQPLSGERFMELAGTLGLGLLVRQAVREVAKVIPGVGSAVGAALAGTSTYALGKAFCYYYSAVLAGHVPKAEDLKAYYHQQLSRAQDLWQSIRGKNLAPRESTGG